MRLTIVGASGHGRVVADIAALVGYDRIEFLDDNDALTECAEYPVVGRTDNIGHVGGDVFVAVGNSRIRQEITDRVTNGHLPVLVHPHATIAAGARLGAGSVVMAGAVVGPGSVVGRGCIVNTCASVDHDCRVGDYVHVSVGARLCGTVTVGDHTWIGAGSTVVNNVGICGDCTIGAGAVVVGDITDAGTYVGVPARRMAASKDGDRPMAREAARKVG